MTGSQHVPELTEEQLLRDAVSRHDVGVFPHRGALLPVIRHGTAGFLDGIRPAA